MKLGTENKKAVYALIGLGVVLAYMVYTNLLSGPSTTSTSSSTTSSTSVATTKPKTAQRSTADDSETTPVRAPSGHNEEFKPVLRPKRVEDRLILDKIDPTLRVDILARLNQVPAPTGAHNLFQIGAKPKLDGVSPQVTIVKTIAWNKYPPPLPPPPQQEGPKPPPPPVPINVKYYGWAAPSGTEKRRAFFLDGDDIIVKFEGESIKGHYRVVRIGPETCIVEDTNDKRQQTLTKVADASA
jgi:hypothetical protein